MVPVPIPIPKPLILIVAVGVGSVTFTRGLMAVAEAAHPERTLIALGLFVVCFVLSLLRVGPGLSLMRSGLNAGASFAIALLVASDGPFTANGGAGWYVAAAGCLLVITMVRRAAAHAWIGTAMVVAQTFVWGGFTAVVETSVAVMVLAVVAANVGIRSMANAMRDIRQFGRAEREAVEWQAAQEAHHFERQVRLTQTSRVALPMLRHIAQVQGDLDEDAQQECRVLEQTIRDEIRGRRLLNDAVREQVITHRRRGAFVQVLDDGGLDDLDPATVEPVLDQVAAAIAAITSDRIIIRTAPKGSDKAVTVVAITVDPTAAALGLEDEGEEVDVWLELPRPVPQDS